MISYILAVLIGVVVLVVDQLTKYFIISNFEIGGTAEFINGFIDIIYINNKGGAWGILQGYTWALLAITAILMIICFSLLIKLGKKNKLVFWAMSLILFGGIGNMIDRIFRGGNVIDFPIFNVADCSVVIGGGLLILYFIYDSVKEARNKKTALK